MKDLILPDPLAEHYELVSCLKYSEQASTCLIAVRSSGKTVLLKTASDPLLSKSLLQEKMVLEMIHQTDSPFAASFPRPILLEWYGETVLYPFLYRRKKSEELCESNYERRASEPTALEYLIELTEILHFMHTLTPSLLHRDIKPQNVIVDSFGKCHFIDLGISRFLNSQRQAIRWSWEPGLPLRRSSSATSRRIFEATFIPGNPASLLHHRRVQTGKCGSYGAQREPVRQIVTKATMFDPDKRYQTTEELLPDLLKARYPSVFLPNLFQLQFPFSKTQSLFRLPYFLLFLFTAGADWLLAGDSPGKISSGDDFPEGRQLYLHGTSHRRVRTLHAQQNGRASRFFDLESDGATFSAFDFFL